MRIFIALLLCGPLFGQALRTVPNPDTRKRDFVGYVGWQLVGVGALASRPATCTANQHLYVCNGAGCTAQLNLHYCTATNTWTAQGGVLAANPAACSAGQYVTDIAADGTLTCATLSSVRKSDNSGDALTCDATGNCSIGTTVPDGAPRNSLAVGGNVYGLPIATGLGNSADADLSFWRFDPYPLTPLVANGTAFGNSVYDPVAGIWRLYYMHAANDASGATVYQVTGSNARAYSGPTSALPAGAGGAWDSTTTGVPYVWYEAGQARPWRMLYRGCLNTACQIGLATSLDGVSWERKDTAGNVLSAPVVTVGAAGRWDATAIDFGSVIKVGSVYYLYYNSIGAPRRIGLATSTDLVTWTKDANNPLWQATVGYQDQTTGPGVDENGLTDNTAGVFCADIVYWPRTDGSERYVFVTPHYRTGGVNPSLDLYVCDAPTCYQHQRTFIGAILRSDAPAAPRVSGAAISTLDTPRIITDDITRNVVSSTGTGNNVLMVTSVANTSLVWNHVMLVYDKSLFGAVLSSIYADLPASDPAYTLQPSGSDSNTAALWMPGTTGTLRELSGTGINPAGKYTQIDANGIRFTAANSEHLNFSKNTTAATEFTTANANGLSLMDITADFTLEATVIPQTMASFNSGYRGILALGNSLAAPYHFYWLVQYVSGDYKIVLMMTSGDAVKTYISPAISLTDGVKTRLALVRSEGTIYAFQDGVSLDAGQAFAWVPDAVVNPSLTIGANQAGTSYYWDGWIDEVRISNKARWTTDYTPAPLTYGYVTIGTIFTRVHDYGAAEYRAAVPRLQVTAPSGTVGIKARAAANTADQSSDIGDFSALYGATGRYQQFAITLTGDGTATPTVSGVQ
jgi:hypothetical protein